MSNQSNGTVSEVTPGGTVSTFATGFDTPQFIAIPSVVPEPASLTLLGLGLAGMVGYGWRRRKIAGRVSHTIEWN